MLWFIFINQSAKTFHKGHLNTSYVMVHRRSRLPLCMHLKNLNTSYVMVHQTTLEQNATMACIFKYILCYGSSLVYGDIHRYFLQFKYILCYGSSHTVTFPNFFEKHLNTSYVMVHLWFVIKQCSNLKHLNTSYVMVHQLQVLLSKGVHKFKYILCYGSSLCRSRLQKSWLRYLNTSYVMVHPATGGILLCLATIFKYTLCYGSSQLKHFLPIFHSLFKYILCYGSSPLRKNSAVSDRLI